MKPGSRGPGASKRSSYSTLIIIICFSIGLLGGYLILGSPRTVDHVDAVKAEGSQIGTGAYTNVKKTWNTRRELITPKTEKGGVIVHSFSSPDLPRNVALSGAPPAKGEVSKEMADALKQQQSDTSERAGPAKGDMAKEMAAALKQQQSDKSETAAVAKTDDQKGKAELMKAQQSDKSDLTTASPSARQEQAKTAVAGGANDAAAAATAAATTSTTTAAAAGTTGAAAATTNAAAATANAAASTTNATSAAAATDNAAATTTNTAATTTNTAATTTDAATTTTNAAGTTTNAAAATTNGAATSTNAAATTGATAATNAVATTAVAAATITSAAASTAGATPGGTTATAAASPSPPPPTSSPPPPTFKGVFPDANTWPITPVKEKMPGNNIHTLFTSNGSPYQNIQARIMVGTYNIVRKMPGGERLVALTRILHRTTPDEVMDEIPTFLAQPLQPECDKWCWFPVADRANAVQQWINAAEKDPSLVKAPWLLLLETDYVWMKPLPDPGDAYDRSVPGWSFGFDYISPSIPLIVQLLKERCPDCDPSTIPNSGPAPVLARFSDFKAATPIWEELSEWIETHEDAKKMLGWVREMYAWDIAVAANKLNIRNAGPPSSPLISQPPHDRKLGNASMYHYTWGSIYKKPNVEKEIWMFDKRTYTKYEDQLKLPLIPMPPEWSADITLQDGIQVTQELHATVVDMLSRMNEAIRALPDLTEAVKRKKEAEANAGAAATAVAS